MKIIIAQNDASFCKEAGRLFLESAHESIKGHGRFSVVLSGGSTPKKIYEHLRGPYYHERIPWSQIDFFWGDERCVPPNHPESNYGTAYKELLMKKNIPPDHIYRMAGEIRPPHQAARDYENKIRAYFKVERSVPQFDFVFLGMGSDGHTASLFPGTVAVHETIRWVMANHVQSLSADRITLTFPVLNNARKVVILCAGESKAKILKEIFQPGLPLRYPIQKINPATHELVWVLDRMAASKMPHLVRDKALHV